MSTKALERHLAPLGPFLDMSGVTEICINRPQEVYVEREGKFTAYPVEELTYAFLETLASLVAESNHHNFPAPFLSGTLLNNERIQFVLPPACEKDKVICSIRRHQMRNMRLEDYVLKGAFVSDGDQTINCNCVLKEMYQDNDVFGFLRLAVQSKKNILISGGTGTGKTTLLNACLKEVPMHERTITVEDTREVNVIQPNAVHLLFNEDDGRTTSLNVFKACLRLRPDRILLSELRGKEVWPYLRAANSGHPGSLSTVHADSPEGAFMQLVFMMQQAGSTSSEEQIKKYVKSIIDIVIQLKRSADTKQFVHVSEVWYRGNADGF